MLIHLPDLWIVIIDIVAWFVFHMSIAFIGTILPERYINTHHWLFKERNFEQGGKFYEKYFFIKKWKKYLPDGSALFKKGFKKNKLNSTDKSYFDRFILELCRAEAVHWAVIFISPIFFIWNYEWASWVMILYAIVANMPCILAQRYNRIRFKKIISRKNF